MISRDVWIAGETEGAEPVGARLLVLEHLHGLLVALGVLFRFRERTKPEATEAAHELSCCRSHWGWEIVAYFFLGGVAAGSYFLAVLIEWFGSANDAPIVRIAYLIAFPLILVCSLLLVIDLDRPERFWHMLLKSEVAKQAVAEVPTTGAGWRTMLHAPALKYWSPMSAGSWALQSSAAARSSRSSPPCGPSAGRPLVAGTLASAHSANPRLRGRLLRRLLHGRAAERDQSAMWSETVWLAPLFLASAASTSLATLSLIARWKNIGTPTARERMSRPSRWPSAGNGDPGRVRGLARGQSRSRDDDRARQSADLRHADAGHPHSALLHGRIGHRRSWAIPRPACVPSSAGCSCATRRDDAERDAAAWTGCCQRLRPGARSRDRPARCRHRQSWSEISTATQSLRLMMRPTADPLRPHDLALLQLASGDAMPRQRARDQQATAPASS